MDKCTIGKEIGRLANIIRREMDKTVGDTSGTNGWIIGYIAENAHRDVFQRDIEREFSVCGSTVSRVIGLMEQKGYIRREPVGFDARLKKLVLTDKAKEVSKEIAVKGELLEKKMVSGITRGELEAFSEVCEKIRRNFNEK